MWNIRREFPQRILHNSLNRVFYFVILSLWERLCWTIVERERGRSFAEKFLTDRKKPKPVILITSLNSYFLRPLCRRKIKQLSWFAPAKLFDRSRIALTSISVSRVVVKPPSSPSPFSLVTVGQGQGGWKGRDKDTETGEGNDVLPRRSPKAGSRFERRSLTFFRSPGSWLPRDLVPYVPNDLEDLPSIASCLCRLPPFTLDQIARWESRYAQRTGRAMVYERVKSSFRLSCFDTALW